MIYNHSFKNILAYFYTDEIVLNEVKYVWKVLTDTIGMITYVYDIVDSR